jgi:hypothetical protein
MPGEFYIENQSEKTDLSQVLEKLTNDDFGLQALEALLNALGVKADSIQSQLGKLSGEPPVSGSVTDNWNSGTATSGETGADVVTLGASGTRKKLHSLLLNISAFQSGAKVTVKLFMKVNGTERKVYEQEFKQGTDPDGLWIVNGTVSIHEGLRVEAESDKAADDGAAMDYDYMLEAI